MQLPWELHCEKLRQPRSHRPQEPQVLRRHSYHGAMGTMKSHIPWSNKYHGAACHKSHKYPAEAIDTMQWQVPWVTGHKTPSQNLQAQKLWKSDLKNSWKCFMYENSELSTYLPIYLSIYLFIYLSIYLSILHLSTDLHHIKSTLWA